MKYPVLIFTLLVGMIGVQGQNSKRGIAYGHHSPEDLQVLSPELSWWYNWSEAPESSVANVFEDYGFEFVPMTWNGSFSESKLRQFLSNHPETKYLLAFNEPNFLEQANMTPSQVAAQWPRLEAIADEFNLKIVAPAVNYCGNCVQENGTTYTDPFEYLDDFFAACPDCQVDHIAVHSYMNTVAALEWYIGEFEKYNKPIWLTEFAGWEYNGNINNLNDQMNFMIGAVDCLESNPNVFRYAWFIGRGSGTSTFPYIDLLGSNGTLTALGEVYKKMPEHRLNQLVDIPGTIEAEAYNQMSGILIEKTTDQTGFANVGYIDTGDWLEYKINVSQSADYDVKFRIASTRNASLKLILDGNEVLTQSLNNTNGWQNWSTISNTINLTGGIHTLRVQAATDGFNINWIQIGDDTATGIPKYKFNDNSFTIYPNPGRGTFTVQNTEPVDELHVLNLNGTTALKLTFAAKIDLSMLPAGMYFIKALTTNGQTVATSKLVIN
ncbi:glycosyl hydrolase [Sunxiuqinia sp. A32]|uniref:glycosyl hydrolase n=1 Tax=Sunxiuqinia sp. A32 TaxID=3461496 RepID=UPI004046549C